MKTDVYVLELWNRGVSEWLLFNVKMSNSSALIRSISNLSHGGLASLEDWEDQ
jgi:hypothetical protein